MMPVLCFPLPDKPGDSTFDYFFTSRNTTGGWAATSDHPRGVWKHVKTKNKKGSQLKMIRWPRRWSKLRDNNYPKILDPSSSRTRFFLSDPGPHKKLRWSMVGLDPFPGNLWRVIADQVHASLGKRVIRCLTIVTMCPPTYKMVYKPH